MPSGVYWSVLVGKPMSKGTVRAPFKNVNNPLHSTCVVKRILGCCVLRNFKKKWEVISNMWPNHKGVVHISESVGGSKDSRTNAIQDLAVC